MQNATPEELFARAREEPSIASIIPALSDFDGDVYLVGGSIRDLLLGRPSVDVDLAVSGDPARLAAAIAAPDRIETRFGTVSVEHDGRRYDLARTRRESYASPGALPDVQPAEIEADLERRDFTINALALGLTGAHAGRLLTVRDALDDLAAGRLAVLHDGSFRDDPTRLLRLARYCARLGFDAAAHTRELAATAIAAGALATVSGTRLGNELRLLAGEPDPVAAFEAVAELGLPWSLAAQPTRTALEVLPADGRADLLVLGAVFGRWQNGQLGEELDRLGFNAGDRDAICEGAGGATDLARRLAEAGSGSEIARAVARSRIETVALAFGESAPSQALTWLRTLRHLELEITGEDLIRHGVGQGPAIGRALQAARDALMDGRARDRESQLHIALTNAR